MNDTYGHLAGDYILREIAKIIRENIRESDLAMGYGGEEFLIAFYDADGELSFPALERIRSLVENHEFVFEGKRIDVTVSIGVAVFSPEEKVSIEEVVERADRSLYDAKRSGKNRVVEFGKVKG